MDDPVEELMMPETDDWEVLVPKNEDVGADPVSIGPTVVEVVLPVGKGAPADELELIPPETLDPVEPTTPLDKDELSVYIGYRGVYDGAAVDKILLPE